MEVPRTREAVARATDSSSKPRTLDSMTRYSACGLQPNRANKV